MRLNNSVALAAKSEIINTGIAVEYGRDHKALLKDLRNNSTGKLKIIYSNLSKLDRAGFSTLVATLIE